ncbi:MAG: hypothetical protein IAE80_18120 [Anaerolinea sp.]|nr:hypothetical protein [Anaerolinea sp.]
MDISRPSFAAQVAHFPVRLLPKTVKVPLLRGALRGRWWFAGASTRKYWLGKHDLEREEAITSCLRPDHVFYDIGAEVGYYTLLGAHLVGERGQVFSFENELENLSFLTKHVQINHVSNVTIFGVPGEGEASIDTLVGQGKLTPPSVIHIHVPGKELTILQGAIETLKRYSPVIILGVSDDQQRTSSIYLFRGMSYQVMSLDYRPLKTSRELLARPPKSQ